MNYTTVAIIGMGPRGLSILERLITLYHHYPYSGDIRLLLIDSNDMGMGVHSSCQPNHLLVNTVACQITLFGDETIKEGGPVRQGPNFHQWAIQQGYRNINGTFVRTTHGGRVIEENDYLPRCLLGEYLDWAYRTFTQQLPLGMRIQTIRQRAINLRTRQDDKTDIILEDRYSYAADFAYITTGHGKNSLSLDDHSIQQFISDNQEKNKGLRYYTTPYPISQLDAILPKTRVLVQGIRLAAYDVLSQLTHGRGGIFSKKDGRLHYTPSGYEPVIALFSRQSLPFSSRGRNLKGAGGQYKPSFFTYDAISHLRRKNSTITGSSQLDFEAQLLPLLLKEMSYVYRSTLQGTRSILCHTRGRTTYSGATLSP